MYAAFTGSGNEFPGNGPAAQDFIVGFDAEFPPYGYMDNGEYVGFDLDLAQGLPAERMESDQKTY